MPKLDKEQQEAIKIARETDKADDRQQRRQEMRDNNKDLQRRKIALEQLRHEREARKQRLQPKSELDKEQQEAIKIAREAYKADDRKRRREDMIDNNKDLKKRRAALEQLKQERAKRNTGIRVI